MVNSSGQRLHLATNRLIDALERLERNLQQVTVGKERDIQQHQHLLNYQRENMALIEEQDRLQANISELQQQYEELQEVAAKIYNKLDNSIEKLSYILEK